MKHKCQQNQMKHDDNSLTGTFHFSLAVWVSERLKRFSIRARRSAAQMQAPRHSRFV